MTVDDTGARHKARNGFCTHIGNDRFACFGTTGSKSRLNFLELLRAGHGDHVINAAALAQLDRPATRRASPPAILVRESYRDGDKVKKRTLANCRTGWRRRSRRCDACSATRR